MTDDADFQQRRALMTGAMVSAGLAVAAPTVAKAQTHPAPGRAAWAPAREKLDDWMDVSAAHRFALDCVTAKGAGAALSYSRVYYVFNKSGYGLDPSSLAVVLVLRTEATPAGYNDAIWAKYGSLLGPSINLVDPVTQAPPLRNIYNTKGVSAPGANGVILSDLVQRGARFAVCGSATLGISEYLAKATGGEAGAIHAELVANLVPGARLAPAGIIAVSRLQEHGYAVAQAG